MRDLLTRRPIPVQTPQVKVIKQARKTDEIGSDSDTSQDDKGLNDGSKKIKKFNRSDYKNHELIEIGYPTLLEPSAQCKRRYRIPVTFREKGTSNPKTKTRHVLFGSADRKDYIDHHDEEKRLATCKKLTVNDENWAHPNHYRLLLLNSIYDNVGDAHTALLKSYGLDIDSKRAKILAKDEKAV